MLLYLWREIHCIGKWPASLTFCHISGCVSETLGLFSEVLWCQLMLEDYFGKWTGTRSDQLCRQMILDVSLTFHSWLSCIRTLESTLPCNFSVSLFRLLINQRWCQFVSLVSQCFFHIQKVFLVQYKLSLRNKTFFFKILCLKHARERTLKVVTEQYLTRTRNRETDAFAWSLLQGKLLQQKKKWMCRPADWFKGQFEDHEPNAQDFWDRTTKSVYSVLL